MIKRKEVTRLVLIGGGMEIRSGGNSLQPLSSSLLANLLQLDQHK